MKLTEEGRNLCGWKHMAARPMSSSPYVDEFINIFIQSTASVGNFFLYPEPVFKGGYDKFIEVTMQITWTDLIIFHLTGKCQVSGKGRWAVSRWISGMSVPGEEVLPPGCGNSPGLSDIKSHSFIFPWCSRKDLGYLNSLLTRSLFISLHLLGNHSCHLVLFSGFLSSGEKKKKTVRKACAFVAVTFRDGTRGLDVQKSWFWEHRNEKQRVLANYFTKWSVN